MLSNDWIELIITLLVTIPIVVVSIFLLHGRGSSLIAGFNTLPKEEQDKYDKVALCKFMGKILLPIGLATPLASILEVLQVDFPYSTFIYVTFTLLLCGFALIYVNTGNRFKK